MSEGLLTQPARIRTAAILAIVYGPRRTAEELRKDLTAAKR